MDIKLKMGAKNSLPSAKDRGTVYFAKDGDKNFGELYYDDENGNRVKVGGTNLSSAEFIKIYNADKDINENIKLELNFEDGTVVTTNEIPAAGLFEPGILIPTDAEEIQDMPLGVKLFLPGVGVGSQAFQDAMNTPSPFSVMMMDGLMYGLASTPNSVGVIVGADALMIGTANEYTGIGIRSDDQSTIYFRATDISNTENFIEAVFNYDGFWTHSLGNESEYIPAAFIEEITADSIHSTMFTGAFTGDLEGNAKTATSWFNSIVLNGTEVKGDETEAITTAKWGTARNISISGTAGTTGTSIDGSSEEGYTLIIPQTLTNFTSITSTTMMATNLGSAATPVTTSHFKDTYFHNPNNNNYKHKLTSNAGSATCELQLPNTSGLLLSKPNATTSVGDVNSPVYVAVNGEVTACTTIAVDHGGTGAATLATGGLLYGNGTSAVGTVNPTTKGRILVANGSNAAPIYASPTLSFTTGTNNPKVKMVINDATYESASGIQSATASNPGIVSTGTQTFAGAKTFNGAVTFGAGITSTTGTFSGQINANADIKIAAKIKSHSSGTSYITLTDSRATVTSPTLHLNGTTLVLNSSNYGTSLPTTGLEEGRVFFLLT